MTYGISHRRTYILVRIGSLGSYPAQNGLLCARSDTLLSDTRMVPSGPSGPSVWADRIRSVYTGGLSWYHRYHPKVPTGVARIPFPYGSRGYHMVPYGNHPVPYGNRICTHLSQYRILNILSLPPLP